jgi:hypothetical protein
VTPVPTELRCALFVALIATSGEALRAEPIRASLTVTRNDGARDCPDGAALALRVEQVAGKLLFETGGATPTDTWVQVSFVRDVGGLRAVISARGQRQGTRTLDDIGPECISLADAVAITLAILLDPATAAKSEALPSARSGAPSPPSSKLGTTAPVAAAATALALREAPPPTATAAARGKTQKPLAFGVEVSAGASLDVLDDVAPLVEAGARARVGAVFALGAGGGFVLPDRVEYGGGSIDVSLGFGYVRGCANLLPRSRTMLEACVEPMFGGLRGSGNDYQRTYAEWIFWSAAAALVQAYGPIGDSMHWSLRARVLTPFARHGFSVVENGGPEQAFELSAVAGTLAFGLEARL